MPPADDSLDGREPRIRKRLRSDWADATQVDSSIDITRGATISYSSESPEHPIENILDRRDGPGGTYWQSERVNVTEQVGLEFDAPQSISRLIFEVQESRLERTQEIRIEVLRDGIWSQLLVQEYTFSPQGATFQREDVRVNVSGVTQLRLTIVPNKNHSGKATLTSLRLFT